jgi:hypothetical protein
MAEPCERLLVSAGFGPPVGKGAGWQQRLEGAGRHDGVSASKVLGVVLVGAVVFGVLVSVRYLLLAYLVRDWDLAWVAAAALVVFGIVALLLAAGDVL